MQAFTIRGLRQGNNPGGFVSVASGQTTGSLTYPVTFGGRTRVVASHNGTGTAVGTSGSSTAVSVTYASSSTSSRSANFIAIGSASD